MSHFVFETLFLESYITVSLGYYKLDTEARGILKTLVYKIPKAKPEGFIVSEVFFKAGSGLGTRLNHNDNLYRLYHVSSRFTHREPKARGCVSREETEPSDITDLYHGLSCHDNVSTA